MRRTLAVGAFLLLASAPVWAQRTTGGISGTARDSSGGVLPGVTVSVSGPNIVGTPSSLTNAEGFYRFLSLPPGEYQVTFTMSGFKTVTRRSVRVSVGSFAEEDARMEVSQIEESVDVVADSSVVDTTSNEVGSNFDREWVENAPLRRASFFDLVAAAPGSLQAGDASTRTMVYGSSYDENSFQVDGVDITDNYFNEALAEPNVDAIDEVEVLSLGAPAEYGNLSGAVYNIVTRQGTNEFHGDLNFFWQDNGLTSNNTDGIVNPDGTFFNTCSDGVGRCPWKRDQYTDFTAQLGGPIVKDKLWFFVSYGNQRDGFWDSGVANSAALLSKHSSDRYFGKLNWQLNPNHKLVGTFHLDKQQDDNGPADLNAAPSTAATRRGTTPTPGLAYTGVLSKNTVLDVRYSGFYGDVSIGPTDPNQPKDLTHFIDQDTGVISGGHYYWYELSPKRNTVTAKVSHLADQFLGASHDFRFGVQYSDAQAPGLYGYNDLVYTYSLTNPGYGYGIARTPFSYNGASRSVGVFVDDTVRLRDRLSLNLGVRYDYNKAYSPEQDELDENGDPTGTTFPKTDYYTWKQFSPRLGFNWRVTGDGKTVLKGHWGRYHRAVATGEYANVIGPNVKPYFAGTYDIATNTFNDLTPISSNEQLGVSPNYESPYTDQAIPHDRARDQSRSRRVRELREQTRAQLRGLGGDEGDLRADPLHGRPGRGRHRAHVPHLRHHLRSGRPLLPDREPARAEERHQRGQLRDQPAHAQQLAAQRLGHLDAGRGLAAGRPGRRRRAGVGRRHRAARRPAVPQLRPQPEHVRERRRPAAQRRRVADQDAAGLPAAGRLHGLGQLLLPLRRAPHPAHPVGRGRDRHPGGQHERADPAAARRERAHPERDLPRCPAGEGLQGRPEGEAGRVRRYPEPAQRGRHAVDGQHHRDLERVLVSLGSCGSPPGHAGGEDQVLTYES
jgi:outer membrane receptor protein involved in Fe transport